MGVPMTVACWITKLLYHPVMQPESYNLLPAVIYFLKLMGGFLEPKQLLNYITVLKTSQFSDAISHGSRVNVQSAFLPQKK